MTTSASLGGQSPQFGAFLFAPVGEDRNGTMVSVLSALARFGVDPWKEAETLAGLPQTAAADRLDAVILALANVPAASADHHGIAARLIALLPQRGTIQTTVRNATGRAAPDESAQVILWSVVVVIILFGQAMALRPDSGATGDTVPDATSASVEKDLIP